MLTSRMQHRRRTRPATDILHELAVAPAKFVERVRSLSITDYQRQLLLKLISRTEQELLNDIAANWYILHQGQSPIDHDYAPIPDSLLPQVNTVPELEQYLNDLRKQRAGITPVKTIRTDCKAHFVLQDPAITEQSQVTVEIAPEIVEIQNGRMIFDLAPNGHQNLIVKIRN